MTNAIAKAFVTEVRNITGVDAAQVLDEATKASSYSSVKKTMIFVIILFALLGCVGTCARIFIKTLTSEKILEVNECSLDGSLEIIGILPDFNVMQ
jgi:capsular polysaccharide biosynthesis protein